MLTFFLSKIVFLTLKINSLSVAIYELWPRYLTEEKAMQHAFAAVMYSTEEWPAERLLAIARVETNFEPSDTSRKDGVTGKRVTGKWHSRSRGASFVAPYFCGALQTKALTWAACLEQRDLLVGYATGVKELRNWMRLCQQKKYSIHDYRCALAGHGGGGRAARRVEREIKHRPRLKLPYWFRVAGREKILRDHLAIGDGAS